MIKLELTPQEAEIVHKALKCWELEPHKDTIGTTMLATIMGVNRNSPKEKIEGEIKARFDKSEEEVLKREMQCLMLRAKIAQAEARASEHMDVAEGTTERPG